MTSVPIPEPIPDAGPRVRRALAFPLLPLGLLSAVSVGLLTAGQVPAALCAVAAIAGVALSGST
jgi:hypothetical protein